MVKRYTSLPFALIVCSHLYAQTYCAPTFLNGCFGWHSMEIGIGTTNWSSDGTCTNSDHMATTAIMEAGVAVPVTVTNGVWCGVVVWVDLDNNMAFEDNERLFSQYTGGDPNYTYLFEITIPIGTAPGNYRMRIISPWGSDGVTSTNGTGPCGEYQYGNFDDFTATVTAPIGIEENNATSLVVGPNPTAGQFNIRTSGQIQRITVSSVDGRIVWNERNLNTNSASIDLGAQPSGLYTVRCESGNTSNVVRVVKE